MCPVPPAPLFIFPFNTISHEDEDMGLGGAGVPYREQISFLQKTGGVGMLRFYYDI